MTPSAQVSYEYDASGNRTKMTDDTGTTLYTYDAAGELQAAGGIAYSYDANGNMVAKTTDQGVFTYQYGADDRLAKVELPNHSYVTYSYDALGRKAFRHQEAENLRNGGGTSTGDSGSSGSSSSGSGSSGGSSSSGGGYESQPTFEQIMATKLNRLASVAGPEYAQKIATAIQSKWANIRFEHFLAFQNKPNYGRNRSSSGKSGMVLIVFI